MATLLQKLKCKASAKRLAIAVPENVGTQFGRYDNKPAKGVAYDEALAFVHTKAELNKVFPIVMKALKPDGLLWIFYPKKSGGIKTDISRDEGWEVTHAAGMRGVALVSMDSQWSAFRLREQAVVKSKSISRSGGGKYKFKARIEKPDDGMDTAYVKFPYDTHETFGAKGQVKVKAMFEGVAYRGVLANMGMGCHIIIVRKDIREKIGKKVGDTIDVSIEADTEPRTLEIPSGLAKAFGKQPLASEFFDNLSYTNRKEYITWITSAKKDETRQSRLEQTIEKLLKGLKNPSQK